MYETAKLTGYRVDQTGTELRIFVPGKNLQETIINRKTNECEVYIPDKREITADQRKKIYATFNDISEYTGYDIDSVKVLMKSLHMVRTKCDFFSLSNCSIEVAKSFINTIIDYCLENGVQLKDTALNRTSDIDHYLWKCLKERVCCICGKPHSDIHHIEAIGRGYDRNKYDDSEHLKACLCRNHHTESHTIGQSDFMKKYKVYGIKYKEE